MVILRKTALSCYLNVSRSCTGHHNVKKKTHTHTLHTTPAALTSACVSNHNYDRAAQLNVIHRQSGRCRQETIAS